MIRSAFLGAFLGGCLLLAACGGGSERQEAETPKVKVDLETLDGGFFTIQMPVGWEIVTAGACSEFAFLIRDPADPLRQVFYFGQVGPVYMSEQQKMIDRQYVAMGGYPSPWLDMPVVAPLTPANFLAQFGQIARTGVAQSFMPQCPRLDNFQVVSTAPQPCPFPGGSTELVRALFTRDGRVGEGLFFLSVAPLLPYTGGPGGGNAVAFMLTGITSPKELFPQMEEPLRRCVGSFHMSEAYVRDCMARQNQTYGAILRAGKTLSDASDIIMEGWESRNRTDDIVAERRSDAILGRERLYDPETGEVYEFDNGFYDTYLPNQDRYEMSNLQPLPEDAYDLWTRAPLDGPRHLR